jgi:PAS domain S-box-containing protein
MILLTWNKYLNGRVRSRKARLVVREPADLMSQIRRLALVWLVGALVLALATYICRAFTLDESAAKCVFLAAVVSVSLMDSGLSSFVFCLVTTVYIDLFFAQPAFSLHLPGKRDLPALVTFLFASSVITALMRRTRSSAELQREQARLLDLTHDTVIVCDMANVIMYWNFGAEELYGWRKDEAVGKVLHQVLHTRFLTPPEEITDTLLRTGRWEGELVRSRRDGSEVVIASRCSLQRNAGGRPLATIETGNDVTAQKRTEEALRRCQATYLAEAQRLSGTGSFGWEVKTGEVFWSEETFRIFEYSPDVVPTLDLVLQRVHPADILRVKQTIEQVTTALDDFDFEHRLLMPDGSVKHLHVVARPICTGSRRLQYAGAVMDVTAARLAEKRLHDAHSELARVSRVTTLGQLSASIAHEVSQPLAAIVGHGEACMRWLERHPTPHEEVRASVARIINDGQRASEVIRRIRMLATKGIGQKAPLELNDVINDVIPLTQSEILNHQVSLRVKLASSLRPVLGDRVQLQQVLINLIINGLQSMDVVNDRPRELTIVSDQDAEGNVIFEVQDCGTGLSSENANELFNAFFTTKPHGMGIGLTICRSIVEAHGGKIWAFNNATQGVTFRCALPSIDSGFE